MRDIEFDWREQLCLPLPLTQPRLNDNLTALGQIGQDEFGMQRVAFSQFDVAGRSYVMELMQAAGMSRPHRRRRQHHRPHGR